MRIFQVEEYGKIQAKSIVNCTTIFAASVLQDEHSGVFTYNIPKEMHNKSTLNLAKVSVIC